MYAVNYGAVGGMMLANSENDDIQVNVAISEENKKLINIYLKAIK
jgi:hypothetical protein